jgi:hypothetical protein
MDSHNAIFKLGTNLSSELVPDGAHIALRSSTRQTKLQGTNVLDLWTNTGATTKNHVCQGLNPLTTSAESCSDQAEIFRKKENLFLHLFSTFQGTQVQ